MTGLQVPTEGKNVKTVRMNQLVGVSGQNTDQQIQEWMDNVKIRVSYLFFLFPRFYPPPKDTVKVCLSAGGQIFS